MLNRRQFTAAAVSGFALSLMPRALRAQNTQAVRVGVVAGLSGLGGQIGQWMVDGAQTAVSVLNKSGGGRTYSLIAEDCQWNAQKGVEAFNKLVNIDKVDVLLSGGSAVMEAIAPLADQRQLVNMNVGAQAPTMAGIGKFTFSVLQLADFDIRVLTQYAAKTMGLKSAAMLYINNDTGKFNQAEFAKGFQAQGGSIVAAEAFKPNETNYGAQLAKIRAANPAAIYVVGTPAEMPFAVKQTRAMVPNAQILAYAGIESQEFLDAAGDAAEGIIYTTTAFDPTSQSPAVKTFVEAYRALKNADPKSPYIGFGYDAMTIIDTALKEDGGKTGEPLREAIYKIRKFPGVTGDNVFQDNGTVSKSIAVKKVEGKQFKVVTVVAP
jgi:branched-chain amino acid transport system substrate-binding protein